MVDFSGELIGSSWTGLSSIGFSGSQSGYTIVNFTLMYIIGAYLRLTEESRQKESKRELLTKFLACTIILFIWALVNYYTIYKPAVSAWEYCNPFVILQAVLIFEIFRNIRIEFNNGINELAQGAFTVYLLHSAFLGKINVEKYVTACSGVMLLHMTISITTIYIVCWIVYEVYENVTSPLYKVLLRKIPLLGKDLVGDESSVKVVEK